MMMMMVALAHVVCLLMTQQMIVVAFHTPIELPSFQRVGIYLHIHAAYRWDF